jgi:hypothetical protein
MVAGGSLSLSLSLALYQRVAMKNNNCFVGSSERVDLFVNAAPALPLLCPGSTITTTQSSIVRK